MIMDSKRLQVVWQTFFFPGPPLFPIPYSPCRLVVAKSYVFFAVVHLCDCIFRLLDYDLGLEVLIRVVIHLAHYIRPVVTLPVLINGDGFRTLASHIATLYIYVCTTAAGNSSPVLRGKTRHKIRSLPLGD